MEENGVEARVGLIIQVEDVLIVAIVEVLLLSVVVKTGVT